MIRCHLSRNKYQIQGAKYQCCQLLRIAWGENPGVRNQNISILHPSNCAVLTLRKSDQKKKVCACFSFRTFTNVHSYAEALVCFTAFHGRDVHDAGDFICLAEEREKQCPGRRLPLNEGELTALKIIARYKQCQE